MCEVNAYVIENGKEDLLLKDVASLDRDGKKILLVGLFGDQRTLEGEIEKIDFLNHKILIRRS